MKESWFSDWLDIDVVEKKEKKKEKKSKKALTAANATRLKPNNEDYPMMQKYYVELK